MQPFKRRQLALKPQDLVVVLKTVVNQDRHFTFAELGRELFMSPSEVHAATLRAETSRLLQREDHGWEAVRTALHEFIFHGVKYAFPPIYGPVTRGLPTSIGAPPLKSLFMHSDSLVPVWPDSEGQERGISLQPLYASVPSAARVDSKLYEVLVLVDAVRAGAAREREIAINELSLRI